MTRKQAIKTVARRIFTENSLGNGPDQGGSPGLAHRLCQRDNNAPGNASVARSFALFIDPAHAPTPNATLRASVHGTVNRYAEASCGQFTGPKRRIPSAYPTSICGINGEGYCMAPVDSLEHLRRLRRDRDKDDAGRTI